MGVISGEEVYRILKSRGVRRLHHANTLATSLSFLREGALLSRAACEASGFPMTRQRSDPEDHRFEVWNDVFFDSVDIHSRASKRCYYGPVLFVVDAEILSQPLSMCGIEVTKANPMYWEKVDPTDRWFEDADDLAWGFQRGNFAQHVVFRNCKPVELSLARFLLEIVLDDPKIADFGTRARTALQSAINEGPLGVEIRIRECDGCKCHSEYDGLPKLAKRRMFDPNPPPSEMYTPRRPSDLVA